MARNAKRLIAGSLLSNSAASYYEAVNVHTTISAMTLTNSTGSARTVTIHLVPSGGSASSANAILSARSIAAGESYVVASAIGQTLAPGGSIQALADTGASVSLVASGYEQT